MELLTNNLYGAANDKNIVDRFYVTLVPKVYLLSLSELHETALRLLHYKVPNEGDAVGEDAVLFQVLAEFADIWGLHTAVSVVFGSLTDTAADG